MRLVVCIDSGSKLNPKEVTEQLACYYLRTDFLLVSPDKIEITKFESKTPGMRVQKLAELLRIRYPAAQLCAAVVGGGEFIPNSQGVAVTRHAELYACHKKGESESGYPVLLYPDLNFELRDWFKQMGEDAETHEIKLVKKDESTALEALIDIIRLDLDGVSAESEKDRPLN